MRQRRQLPGVARTQTWFGPDLEHARHPDPGLGNAPATPFAQGLTGWDAAQDRWLPARWYQPEDAWAGLEPPAVPFDASLVDFGRDGAQDDWRPTRWFAPEAAVEGDVPRVNAPTHPDHGWDARADVDRTQRWFAPEPTADVVSQLPNAPTAATLEEQPQDWRPEVRFAPDESTNGFEPIPDAVAFDPSTVDWGYDPERDRPSPTWPFADTLLGVNVATEFDPVVNDFGYDASRDIDRTARWFQPDTEAWTPIPDLTVASVEQQAALWQEQPQAWTPPLMVQPADEPTLFTPGGFDPTVVDYGADAQQDRWLPRTWFAPEAAVEGDVPRVNASRGAELEEQPQAWTTQQWPTVDDGPAPFQPTPAAPFDPSTGFDWSEQPQAWQPVRWVALDLDVAPTRTIPPPKQIWYFTDRPYFNPTFGGDSARIATLERPWGPVQTSSTPTTTQSFIVETGTSRAYRWYLGPITGPGGADPGPSGYFIPSVVWFRFWYDTDIRGNFDYASVNIIVAGQFPSSRVWEANYTKLFSIGGRTLYEFVAMRDDGQPTLQLGRDSRVSIELLVQTSGGTVQTFAFNSDTADVDGDTWVGFLEPITPLPLAAQSAQDATAQQDSPTTQRWFAPDHLPGDGLVPIPDAVFDPAPFADAWGDHSAQQTVSTAQTWFAPEAATLGDIPRAGAGAFDPATGFDWSEQPQQPSPTPWAAGGDVLLGTQGTTEFDPANLSHGWDTQQDHDTVQRWFRPDDYVIGDIPRASAPTTATPSFDYDAQSDRSTQPVWFAPEAGVEAYVPANPTTAPAAEQAPLWIEQPYPVAGNAQRWYSQALEPVDGNLASWLFTTGDPGGTPPVLINAENGDVFLHIGGPFIVPAS